MTETNIDSVVENLMAIQPLLHKNLLKPVRTKSVLPIGALFVLGVLKNNAVLSMSEIGNKLSIPKPHLTLFVDKLITEGFVERFNDSHDRRIINIKVTAKGIENLACIKKDISENLRQKLTKLDISQLDKLQTASQIMKETLITIFEENAITN